MQISKVGYSGSLVDYFSNNWHNGRWFTTPDRDNDNAEKENCALKWKGNK